MRCDFREHAGLGLASHFRREREAHREKGREKVGETRRDGKQRTLDNTDVALITVSI